MDEGSTPTGLVLLRLWHESDGQLHGRVVAINDVLAPMEVTTPIGSTDQALVALTTWIDEFAVRHRSGHGAVTDR